MSDLTTTRLAELVGKRRRCLLQLREVGKKQSELAAAGAMGDLLRMLAAKQELIAALEAIETQLKPYHAQDPDSRRWTTLEARARCAEEAEECRILLGEVIAIEQANERHMTIRRDEVATQLTAMHSAGRVRQAYQANC